MTIDISNLISILAEPANEPVLLLVKVFILLLASFFIARFLGWSINKLSGRRKLARYAEYLVIIIGLFLSLTYMSPEATSDFVKKFIIYLPQVVSALFILVLGFFLVNVTLAIIEWVVDFIKLKSYLVEMGIGSGLLFAIDLVIRIILYLIVIQVALNVLGVSSEVTNTLISAIGWASAILMAGLVFYGTKDLVNSWFSSLTLKSSNLFKPGQRIVFKDIEGEIVAITSFSTVLDTGKGSYFWIPNYTLVNSPILIRKSRFDLKTLESLRRHYVAQEASMCAPASAEMMLNFFGFKVKKGQKEIAKLAGTKVPGGTNAKKLIEAVKKLTKGQVIGLFVPYKDVINLREEIKSWLADGGLVIINFYKAALFPGVKREQKHAVLCVGVEGDNLIIVDPNPTTGGVYQVNYKDMERAMGPFEGEERGYVVYAPRGTRAYWRIQNKLYYSNPMYYERLTKTFERKLKQVLRETRRIENILPEYIKELLDEYRAAEEEKIKRLWSQ